MQTVRPADPIGHARRRNHRAGTTRADLRGGDGRFGPGQSLEQPDRGDRRRRGHLRRHPDADRQRRRCLHAGAGPRPMRQLVALPTDGRAATRSTIDGVGDYRVVASTLPDGSRPGQWTAAGPGPRRPWSSSASSWASSPESPCWQVVSRLLDRPAIAAPAGSGGRRPLVRSATLPLDRGEVDLGVRVPDRDTDTRTEVGQVGAALNQMLGHVSNALVARQASEMRVRQFVADASHELRTPLAAIRGYAELARREEDDTEGVAHALRRVESESARMTTLVDDLLLLARLDSGRPLSRGGGRPDAGGGRRGVRRAGRRPDPPLATGSAGGAGDHDRRPGPAASGAGEPAGQRQDAHPGRHHRLVRVCEPNRDRSVITVTDNGPGIPAALQPEIFNRFVRGDSSRSRAAGSTGLGLAIVAAVVAAHGGTVSVQSRPGQTTFTVVLPHAPTRPRPGAADRHRRPGAACPVHRPRDAHNRLPVDAIRSAKTAVSTLVRARWQPVVHSGRVTDAQVRPATGPLTSTWSPAHPVDPRRTLDPLRRGRLDPTLRVDGTGIWRTSLTPARAGDAAADRRGQGPSTATRLGSRRRVDGGAGTGNAWAPMTTGPSSTARAHPLLDRTRRAVPGLRIPRTALVFESLVPAVLEQRVVGADARRSWYQLVSKFGAPAAGAGTGTACGSARLRSEWGRIPSWEWHLAGVDPGRARTVAAAVRVAAGLQRTVDARPRRAGGHLALCARCRVSGSGRPPRSCNGRTAIPTPSASATITCPPWWAGR